MKLKYMLLAAVAFAASLSLPATAAVYNFNVDYFGGNVASLAAGDDPTATNLQAGDHFNYTLSADGGDYWRIESNANIFPFFSLQTSDAGTRTADFTLTLLLNGVSQFSLTELGINNSSVHIGTNTVGLTAGLEFDQIVVSYDLLASDNGNNRPSSLLPWPGVGPEFWSPQQVSYLQGVVPEPATLGLLGLALVGAGLARSRKR